MSEITSKQYLTIKAQYPGYLEAVESLGQAVKKEGPLDSKLIQLIQLGAAAAIRSEGAVHSHARRALELGATKEELHHAVIVLTSTIGFPGVVAALSWIEDVISS